MLNYFDEGTLFFNMAFRDIGFNFRIFDYNKNIYENFNLKIGLIYLALQPFLPVFYRYLHNYWYED